METNKILDADILDIIFEGRNKQYGAYDLRKTYNKRLVVAIISMLVVCLLLVIGTLLANNKGPAKSRSKIQVQDVNLADLKQEEKKPEPPPPPPLEQNRLKWK